MSASRRRATTTMAATATNHHWNGGEEFGVTGEVVTVNSVGFATYTPPTVMVKVPTSDAGIVNVQVNPPFELVVPEQSVVVEFQFTE